MGLFCNGYAGPDDGKGCGDVMEIFEGAAVWSKCGRHGILYSCGGFSWNIFEEKRKEQVKMKKKAIAIILCTMTTLSLTACSEQEAAQEPEVRTEIPNATGESGNILIAYFTVPETDGTDTEAGASRVAVDGEVLGNNQYIAQLIQQETGGDLFAIETVQEYPGTHDELLEFAYDEMQDNERPELASQIENLDQYDTIILGYPNWNADLPMPVYTFLEEYDFTGKTIIPFTAHGGSGFSGTIQTIEELQPDATVIEDGLSISRNSVEDAQSEVIDWVDALNL